MIHQTGIRRSKLEHEFSTPIAIVGKHDDLLITRAIGMHICLIIPNRQKQQRKRR